ncbi:phage tail protein [uncultured Fibrella sp.]|uniref:phage tail protein n=1 Tax=uncultured Fibrella sp. TaxID=1284596 RepID=UPI0035CB71AC
MEPFIGQICLFGFNFAPKNWAFCNGQLMSIAQNSALFALLGTTYGGDGVNTFALPDLRGRAALHFGSGPGLTPRQMGESSGSENVTLLSSQMPVHNHLLMVSAQIGTEASPTGNVVATPIGTVDTDGTNVSVKAYNPTPNSTAYPQAIGMAGSGQSHQNMQPYLVMNYCIALTGIFPSRG